MARSRPQKRRRAAKPRRRMARRKRSDGNYAECTVTRDLGYDSMGPIYKFSEFSIAGFPRASAISQQYQFYRMTKVTMRFIPVNDTYIAGNPGEVPHLYYVIDKSDSIPFLGCSVQNLEECGAKPIRLDDKTITVSFKPAVTWKALDENGAATNFGMTRTSPWLATNDNNTSDTATWSPSSVDHHGIIYTVTGGTAGSNYHVETTVHFQFKKPLDYTIQIPGQQAVPHVKKVLLDCPALARAPVPAVQNVDVGV